METPTQVLVAKLNESVGEVLTQLQDKGFTPTPEYLADLAGQVSTLTAADVTAPESTALVDAIKNTTVPTGPAVIDFIRVQAIDTAIIEGFTIGTETTTTTTTTTLPSNIEVSGADSVTAVFHATYTFAAGTYTYTIAGFSPGNVLKFFPGAILNVVPDSNETDGIKTITADNSATGTTTTITLTGLSGAQDAGLFNVPSFNTVFGAGTIVQQ